jgi:hypothetical protein
MGSLRQSSGPRNTNSIRHEAWDETAHQVKVQKLHGHASVNAAGIWNEGEVSYRGRSHGRVETEYETRLKKICREKSAEAIVPDGSRTAGKGRTKGGEGQ